MTAKLLTRDQILAADDRATEVCEVPEWGGSVSIRALTGSERDAYEASLVRLQSNGRGGMTAVGVNAQNIRARLVALSVVDPDGKPMFSEKDITALGQKSAAALDRVFSASQRLSGLTDADVEALTAGLKGAPSDSSGSD